MNEEKTKRPPSTLTVLGGHFYVSPIAHSPLCFKEEYLCADESPRQKALKCKKEKGTHVKARKKMNISAPSGTNREENMTKIAKLIFCKYINFFCKYIDNFCFFC